MEIRRKILCLPDYYIPDTRYIAWATSTGKPPPVTYDIGKAMTDPLGKSSNRRRKALTAMAMIIPRHLNVIPTIRWKFSVHPRREATCLTEFYHVTRAHLEGHTIISSSKATSTRHFWRLCHTPHLTWKSPSPRHLGPVRRKEALPHSYLNELRYATLGPHRPSQPSSENLRTFVTAMFLFHPHPHSGPTGPMFPHHKSISFQFIP